MSEEGLIKNGAKKKEKIKLIPQIKYNPALGRNGANVRCVRPNVILGILV